MIVRLFDWIDRCIIRLECWAIGHAVCPVCYDGFVPRGTGHTKKRYCSAACGSTARGRKRRTLLKGLHE